MSGETSEEILRLIRGEVNTSLDCAPNDLSPYRLQKALRLVKELRGVLEKPSDTPVDGQRVKRKVGRPRKTKTVTGKPEEQTSTSEALEKDPATSERNETAEEVSGSEGRGDSSKDVTNTRRSRRKASCRFKEFLKAYKKDGISGSDDDNNDGDDQLVPSGNEEVNLTEDPCTQSPQDTTGQEHPTPAPAQTDTSNQVDKVVHINIERHEPMPVTLQHVPTSVEAPVRVECLITTGAAQDGSNDVNISVETIPTRGPNKLSQAELAFFEGCRMSDGLGWKCPTCHKILNNRANLRVHMRIHTGEKPFSCSLCGKQFSVKVNYKRHLETHKEYFKCQFCGELFDEKELLIAHNSEAHSGMQVRPKSKESMSHHECPECGKSFKFKIEMLRHLKAAHNISKPYRCSKCDGRFSEESHLKKHFLVKHPSENELGDPEDSQSTEKEFKCDICGKILSGRGSYMNHRLTHEENRKFRCQYCPTTYKWKVNLTAHERMHTEDRPYVCNHQGCGKSFTTAGILKRHKAAAHSNEKLKCPECGKLFSYALTLKRHITAIHEKTKSECEICHEKFAYSSNKWRHMKYSHSDKQFECGTCHKKFALKYDLQKHMSNHDNTCTYKCPICSKVFKRADALAKHFQQHKGIPSFQCSKCDKKFMTRAQRDRHSKTCHTGVLIQMSSDVCQDLDLPPEEVTGVKQLLVNPNLVQNLNIVPSESGGVVSSTNNVTRVSEAIHLATSSMQGLVSESQPLPGVADVSQAGQGEPEQTIILLVNSDQDGASAQSVLESGILQKQEGQGNSGTYQILQTLIDGVPIPDAETGLPGNTVAIQEGYKLVFQSNDLQAD